MELSTIDTDLSGTITFWVGIFYSVYIFMLGACRPMRTCVTEILCEVFDAALSDDEKLMLGPAVVVPPLMALVLLGITFMLLNFQALAIPSVLLILATLSTGAIRRKEILRKELEDLGRTDL